MLKDYSETDTWFIVDRSKKKYFKRIGYCTPWKEYKSTHGIRGKQREFLKYKYTEISREDYLNHKCIDCWHPNGITDFAYSIGGVGDDC